MHAQINADDINLTLYMCVVHALYSVAKHMENIYIYIAKLNQFVENCLVAVAANHFWPGARRGADSSHANVLFLHIRLHIRTRAVNY